MSVIICPPLQSVPGLQTLVANYPLTGTERQKAEAEHQIYKARPKGNPTLKRDWLHNYLQGGTGNYDKRDRVYNVHINEIWEEIDAGRLKLRAACDLIAEARRPMPKTQEELKARVIELLKKPRQLPPEAPKAPVVEPKKEPEPAVVQEQAPARTPTSKRTKRKKLKGEIQALLLKYLHWEEPMLQELSKRDATLLERLTNPFTAEIDAALEGCVKRLEKEAGLLKFGALPPTNWNKRRNACKVLDVPFSEKGFDETRAKSTYRQKVIQYHPDRNPNNPHTLHLYQEAVEAWEVLREWRTEQRANVSSNEP